MPFDRTGSPEEFQRPEAVAEIARLLERVGFDGGNVTDHPCPTGRWLDAGGHHAQDPFITACAVATLDVFSGGRVTLGLGAGYLKGEYRALGIDFEKRNEIVDEYIGALKAAWGAEEFSFKGSGYEARGSRILPGPVHKPHPPLLIGGNSRRAIRRAVEVGDAWYPFFTSGAVSRTSRTAPMSG